MTQYKITIDDEIMHGLFQGDEGMEKLVAAVVNQVLDAQVSEQLQALPYERTEERRGYRNSATGNAP